jgi:protein-S-isoprenylcysteine O-methyltransferase Ste14
MRIIWILVFGATMIYVAWWLIYSIRMRVIFEVSMALGGGSLWTAFFAPKLFSDSPTLVNWSLTVSLIGYGLFALSVGLVVAGVLSLRRGGKPTDAWEQTTLLTTSRIHGLVRHPVILSGIVAACSVVLLSPMLPVLILSAVSVICFLSGARAEDKYNVAKFGEPYRVYMEQVPALNLLAGVWKRLWTRG